MVPKHRPAAPPVESCPLGGAMASNSSKKSTAGAAAEARANRSRTAASEAPMYLLSSSGPLTDRKLYGRAYGRAHSHAIT